MNKEVISEKIIRALILMAFEARENSYSVYSHFAVGAAVLSDDGTVFTGCNVENASYPAGSCAETVAINKAVSEGVRGIRAVAVVGGPYVGDIVDDIKSGIDDGKVENGSETIVDIIREPENIGVNVDAVTDDASDAGKYMVRDHIFPCGICRQVISEFRSEKGTYIITAKSVDDYKIYELSELFPGAFTAEALEN